MAGPLGLIRGEELLIPGGVSLCVYNCCAATERLGLEPPFSIGLDVISYLSASEACLVSSHGRSRALYVVAAPWYR